MQEEEGAEFIEKGMTKPVAAYIAGRFSPQGKRMGHAGAIVRGAAGTVEGKCEALQAPGATILETPIDVAGWVTKHNLAPAFDGST